MFSNDDYDKMVNSNMRVPDGIIDGRQYAEIFKTLNGYLEETNPEDYQSNILWIMRCINECYDDAESGDHKEMSKSKAADVVTALSYFCMTMCSILKEVDAHEQYFKHQNEEVIPTLFAECETIPWYDFSEDLKNAHDDMEGDDFD